MHVYNDFGGIKAEPHTHTLHYTPNMNATTFILCFRNLDPVLMPFRRKMNAVGEFLLLSLPLVVAQHGSTVMVMQCAMSCTVSRSDSLSAVHVAIHH